MSGRIPLAPKNPENRPRTGGDGKKSSRSLAPPTMDRASLLESLRAINNLASHATQVRISEEDVVRPSPERLQPIYMMLLNVVFGATPSTFSQVPFQGIPTDYPELYEEHHFGVNFLRSMNRLMSICLLNNNDFSPRDILEPQPKRVQKHLSSIVNYIKFQNFVEQLCQCDEQKSEIEELNEKLRVSAADSVAIQKEIAELEDSKVAKREVEESLKQQITQQQSETQQLTTHITMLEQRLQSSKEAEKSINDSMARVDEEIKRSQERIADLQMQVVTSPEELHQSVDAAREDLEDRKRLMDDEKETALMWETLAKKAMDVAPSVEDTIGEIDELAQTVEKTSQLTSDLQRLVNSRRKLTQEHRSKISKDQNLCGQVKKIEEEINGLSQYARTLSTTAAETEQQKELQALELCLSKKKERDREKLEMIEEMNQKHSTVVKSYHKLDSQFSDDMNSLEREYRGYQQRLDDINRPLNRKMSL